MTPIKHILILGNSIFVCDWSDKAEFLANAESEEKAQWIGWSLAKAHAVKLITEENPNG